MLAAVVGVCLCLAVLAVGSVPALGCRLTASFLYVVVVDLYSEDYATARCRDEVCYEQRPEYVRLV